MATTDPFPVLLARIRTGVYPTGSWLASERDLARDLGVHRNTVRRAVARLADLGVVEKLPGCRPVVRGPAYSGERPKAVALLMGNEPRFHAFQTVVRGCEAVLGAEGYRITFMDTYASTEAGAVRRERNALESLLRHPVEGVILWCQGPGSAAPLLSDLERQGTPIVLIDRSVPGFEADLVAANNVDAVASVVDHLAALGHRRIALVTWQDEASAVREREAGYRAAMRRNGLDVDESLVYHLDSDMHEVAAQAAAADICSRSDPPTAVFAINDIIATHLINALHALGRRIPDDIALVGFDDIESLTVYPPFLTTIRQPYEAMGHCAARLLLERIAQPQAPIRCFLLETPLIVRASTQPSREVQTPVWSPASISPVKVPELEPAKGSRPGHVPELEPIAGSGAGIP